MFGNMKHNVKGKLVELHNLCKKRGYSLNPARFNLASALFQYNDKVTIETAYDIVYGYENNQYSIPGEYEAFIRDYCAA